MSATLMQPASVEALQQAVAEANAARRPLGDLDLSALSNVVAFSPDDMTVTVETGMTLAALQSHLARAGQWLPLDPPHADTTSLLDLLRFDISGPRRLAHGTIREHVLGLAAVTGDGRLIRSGGRVVKNVAGYDLARLLVGDGGSLGVVVEVTFKLSPRPVAERLFAWTASAPAQVHAALTRLQAGPVEPELLDIHNLDVLADGMRAWTLVCGVAGHPDDVAWQAEQMQAEGGWCPLDALDHEARFWQGRTFAATRRVSLPPTRLLDHLDTVGDVACVARAGNGVVYTDEARPPRAPLTVLERRLKATYDPHGILPALS